ncbi:MAG TPA: ABC transporter substrate-binding protein [Caulobacteraceae bacterium]|jgi:iron complex transport system substrate-binding protein|nr:ABC transporter substrate-binding protein [Caulobacteraceae bacterium]
MGRRSLGRAVRAAALAAIALFAFGPVSTAAPAGPPRPRRIVSLNACADQYLMALADRSQIAALTQFARDPSLSFYADRANTYPITQGQAEAVLALRPDLIIASPYRRAETLSLLKGKVRILDVKPAESFPDVVKETRAIASAIGQTARGEALIRSMQARVDAAGRRPMHGVAAHYQRGGFITGPGTLMDDLMTRAGLSNLARRGHGGSLGRLSLEQIIYARPDFLILTDGPQAGQDEGSLSLEHPALTQAVPPARQLHLPAALTVCGGPSYPEALERLQAAADQARRR